MKPVDPRQVEMALWPQGTRTLAHVVEQIGADTNLSDTRRRDMISGMRRLAKAMDRSLAEVPADPSWLQPRLAGLMPAALGISQKTLQNAISDTRAALAHVGIIKRRKNHIDALSPAWRDLWRAVLISRDKSLTTGLGRFIHFLSNLGVAPKDVTQAHAAAFLTALQAEEIHKRPEKSWRSGIWAWNLAVDRINGWPSIRLDLPGRQNVVTLPDQALPPEFVEDLTSVMERFAQPDPWGDDSGARPLRPATVKQNTRMLKRFASELLAAGEPARAIISVAALCEPARAERGLRAMTARNGNKINSVISDMASILQSCARRLDVDEAALAGLRRLSKRVAKPQQKGMTSKNRARLRPLQDPTTLRRLLDLPEALFAKARKMSEPKAGLAREDAVAIGILLVCPLRIGNLAAIHIDRHLQRPGSGRLFCVIEESEVKNGRPLEFELPRDVRRMVDAHLASRSPRMCPSGTPWLFPRRDGTASVNPHSLSTRLSKRIRREIGLAMNPHLFRHLAAMIWLTANPGAYEAARRLLGHSTVSTTINVYAGLEGQAALKAYGEVLQRKRGARS